MNKSDLRALIKSQILQEAASHRIKSIDEAGDIAANEAKIARVGQELDKVNKIKQLMEKVGLKNYLGEKLYTKVTEELDKSINEYETAKVELEEKKSGPKDTKGKKPTKKDKEPKEEVLENEEEIDIDAI